MFRIDTPSSVASLPTPAAAATPGYFTSGNPLAGLQATIPGCDWFNMVQEELMAFLTDRSITPSKTTRNQVLTAVKAIGTASLSPANSNVVIKPTGTGNVQIGPATLGTMDNMSIGQTTAAAVKATTLQATGASTFSPANANVTIAPTGTGTVNIAPATTGALNNVGIGATTPAPGAFTTLSATGLFDLSASGAGQIKFPATQNPSVDSNTLDDYQETKSYTPAFNRTAAYATQTGWYIKIGSFVIGGFKLVTTGVIANGSLSVSLPFGVANSATMVGGLSISQFGGFTLTAGYTQLGGDLLLNSTFANLVISGSAQAPTALTGNMSTGAVTFEGTFAFQAAQ